MNTLSQPENTAPGAPAALRLANDRKAVIMNRSDTRKGGKFAYNSMKKILNLVLIIFALAITARAQDEVPPPMPATTFSDAQLDQLLGPIALYPDPLIAVILPAATLPTQIVMADRYLSNGGDPNQMDPGTYDQNVIALAHYPDVLKWMDDNLNWATQLGQAFQNQQQDVMNSVQRLRTQAYNLGNLQSTPQQQVVDDNGYIEILPANPDDLYVPDYQPDQVYYQSPVGPPFITFSVGFVVGPWLCGDFDWWHHRVVYWDRDHPRPQNWWHEKPDQRQVYLAGNHANVWNPNNRGGVVSGYQGGDRGWNNQVNHNAPVVNHGTPPVNHGAPVVNHGENNPVNQHWTAPAPSRPAPAPTQNYDQYNRNDAFISSQNAGDTRTYSNRGAESTGTHSFSGGGSPGGGGSSGGFHGSTGGGGGGGGSHGGGNTGGGGGGGGGNGRH
jgi:hypothetical protein